MRFAYMRLKMKAELQKSQVGRVALRYYIDWRVPRILRILAKSESKKLRTLLDTNQAVIRIVYDNLASPPVYGEFFQVVMLARYLKASGAEVSFIIIDDGKRRADWEALDLDEQVSLVQDQVELASKLLDAEIEVLTETPNSSSHIVYGANVLARSAIYDKTPLLLNTLIETSEEPLPAGFLLPIGWGKELKEELDLQNVPFVAWNVRKGRWAPDRNNMQEQVITDFRDIRKLFPSHRIVLLSTPDAIDWVFDILLESGDLYSGATEAQILFPQPTTGYINGMPWLLSADEYFQREGGGMGMIAIFSEVPFLMVSENKGIHYRHQLDGEKIVAWASPRQRFVHRPLDAHRVLFSDLYTQPAEVS